MKEYICKDNLMKRINIEPFMKSAPYLLGLIKAQPTVTKADIRAEAEVATKVDICREFAERLKKELNPQIGNYGIGFNYEKMCQRFDEVLAEMEPVNR